MARVRGLDVSEAQGLIDFDKLPSWVRFLIVKVSEGESYKDPQRVRNLSEARARGLHVFVYAFLRTSQDVTQQLANLASAVGDISPSFVFVDFETIADGMTPRQGVAKLVEMCRGVRAQFGRGGVYSYPFFCSGEMAKALAAPEAAELALMTYWSADYRGGEVPPETWRPFCPPVFGRATFVQTSGDKSSFVPGINGHVDHDYFEGSEDELNTFLGVPTAAQSEKDAPIIHPDVEFPPIDYSHEDDPPFEP